MPTFDLALKNMTEEQNSFALPYLPDEKKKVAARRPSFLQVSATEPAIAVLPDPAGPDSHKILFGCSSRSP